VAQTLVLRWGICCTSVFAMFEHVLRLLGRESRWVRSPSCFAQLRREQVFSHTKHGKLSTARVTHSHIGLLEETPHAINTDVRLCRQTHLQQLCMLFASKPTIFLIHNVICDFSLPSSSSPFLCLSFSASLGCRWMQECSQKCQRR
jgi:hypothetical protein